MSCFLFIQSACIQKILIVQRLGAVLGRGLSGCNVSVS